MFLKDRNGMIFYHSYYEAIKPLPDEQKILIYNAIFSYSFEWKKPKFSWILQTIRVLIEPVLTMNNARYNNGKTPKAKQKRTWSKPEAYKDINKDINKDKDTNVSTESSVAKKYGNINYNEIIELVDKHITGGGGIYDSNMERQFAKHLCSKKFQTNVVDKLSTMVGETLTPLKTVEILLAAADENTFWKGKICSLQWLYKNAAKVLNSFIISHNK